MAYKIAVTGSTGLIGRAVCDWFSRQGHTVTRMVRPETFRRPPENSVLWDFEKRAIDLEGLEGHDALIHFAAVNIANRRWTSQYKDLIYRSRIEGTAFLTEALSHLKQPPKFFFSTSAIGFYGNHDPGDVIDESGANGHGFLAELTREWELATKPAELSGIKVTHMRLGVVLSKRGGALGKMLPAFNLGLGGPIGSGKQVMSWIALDDIPSIIHFLIQKGGVSGPVNFTSPRPVTSRDFARILGKVIHRPAILPLPGFMVKTMFGEMGQEMLLSGAHVTPRRLIDAGYPFQYGDLESALNAVLKGK